MRPSSVCCSVDSSPRRPSDARISTVSPRRGHLVEKNVTAFTAKPWPAGTRNPESSGSTVPGGRARVTSATLAYSSTPTSAAAVRSTPSSSRAAGAAGTASTTASASTDSASIVGPTVSRHDPAVRVRPRTVWFSRTRAPAESATAATNRLSPPWTLAKTGAPGGRGEAAMACRTAAARVVCSPAARCRPGMVAARDSSSARPAYTPPSRGSTRRSTTSSPNRDRTNAPTATSAPGREQRPAVVRVAAGDAGQVADGGRIGRYAHERARRDRAQRAVDGERGRNRRWVHQVVAETDPARQRRARPSRGPDRGPGRSPRRSPPAGPRTTRYGSSRPAGRTAPARRCRRRGSVPATAAPRPARRCRHRPPPPARRHRAIEPRRRVAPASDRAGDRSVLRHRCLASMTAPVAVVTGAAQGIGLRIAEVLADAGSDLALFDRQPVPGFEAAVHVVGDVTDEAAVAAFDEAVHDAYGRVDVLVNNAGIACISPAEQTPADAVATGARGEPDRTVPAVPGLRAPDARAAEWLDREHRLCRRPLRRRRPRPPTTPASTGWSG